MSDFFSGLGNQHLDKLETAETETAVAGGSLLFIEGEEGSAMYRLVSGSVRLYRSAPDGREVTIRLIEPGELFAEIILFERETYPATAVALEDSVVGVIRRDRVRKLLAEEDFREAFMQNLVGKMRYLSQQLYVLATMDVRSRLIRFLEVRYGRRREIRSELSKQATAAAISVRPETLSRTLQSLAAEGLLEWKRRTILVDPRLWEEV